MEGSERERGVQETGRGEGGGERGREVCAGVKGHLEYA